MSLLAPRWVGDHQIDLRWDYHKEKQIIRKEDPRRKRENRKINWMKQKHEAFSGFLNHLVETILNPKPSGKEAIQGFINA